MTVLQIYKLTDNNTPQAIISFSDKGGELKSININPCFYKAANRKHIEIVPKNGRKKLHDGDSFALLADSFWFRIQLTSDGHGLNKTIITNKEAVSATTIKQSQSQLKVDESTNVTGDVIEELKQNHMQDEGDMATMKINTLLKEIPPATKHKINPSGKKFKSFEEAITSGEKRNLSDLTSDYCKKIKVEPSVSPNKLPVDKPVVDTKKLLENIRQIVIEDYPEATSLLGDELHKKTCHKERKHLKTTKLVGKNIKMNPSVESSDSNSKSFKPLFQPRTGVTEPTIVDVKSNIDTEEKANDKSGNVSKNEKASTSNITSHGECSPEDTSPKDNVIQQETENTRQLANIASAGTTDR